VKTTFEEGILTVFQSQASFQGYLSVNSDCKHNNKIKITKTYI